MTYLDAVAEDIRRAIPHAILPDEDTSNFFLSYAVLLLAKGDAVTREDVHNAWVAWMEVKGDEHESMVPFDQLPLATQGEDSPFVLAIRAVARSMKEQTQPDQ